MKSKVFCIISIVVFLSIIVFGIFIFNNVIDYKVKVELVKCVDGDTAWFKVNGKKEKVRFLGINTPESVHPNGIIEEYGKEASDYTCNMLSGANDIYIEYDVNSETHDKYDRLLAYVFVDNNNLGELLLSKGYAEVKYIYGDYKYINDYCLTQKGAIDNKLGIWSNNNDYEDNYCYSLYK